MARNKLQKPGTSKKERSAQALHDALRDHQNAWASADRDARKAMASQFATEVNPKGEATRSWIAVCGPVCLTRPAVLILQILSQKVVAYFKETVPDAHPDFPFWTNRGFGARRVYQKLHRQSLEAETRRHVDPGVGSAYLPKLNEITTARLEELKKSEPAEFQKLLDLAVEWNEKGCLEDVAHENRAQNLAHTIRSFQLYCDKVFGATTLVLGGWLDSESIVRTAW
jgi:hypothetical protein